ncbi:thioredoxin family protein [Polaribacter sargassicola]|uniref:thioredoxin family protein n=1 Tax=Polaribacter sargassicola TaxID=2836891 RepID=UPI001F40B1D0|nr:thioredoxin family protein [Polaribacter sp. DS7-9]MCG1037208.1 thioredoxin family protein [Polaribacter sp. DS7-9]
MKKNIITIISCFLLIGSTFSQELADTDNNVLPNWEPTYKGALKKAKEENKPVLIYFTGSDWCGPCIVLDKKLFHSTKFKEIADKDLVLYQADMPRNKDILLPNQLEDNNDLIKKFKIKSFPTLVFVNHKGKMLAYKKGLILTEYYYPFIQSVIDSY